MAAMPSNIYPLSLHDALPILVGVNVRLVTTISFAIGIAIAGAAGPLLGMQSRSQRSEEHTSELQSLRQLVCRLLPEKKNAPIQYHRMQLHRPYVIQLSLITAF